jgi:hypothetical protein
MQPFNETWHLPETNGLKDRATRAWSDSLLRALQAVFAAIARMPFNKAAKVTVGDTGAADTEFAVDHPLGRVPAGFLVANIDAAGVVYDSGTAWTATVIYLKCSAANAGVTLWVL